MASPGDGWTSVEGTFLGTWGYGPGASTQVRYVQRISLLYGLPEFIEGSVPLRPVPTQSGITYPDSPVPGGEEVASEDTTIEYTDPTSETDVSEGSTVTASSSTVGNEPTDATDADPATYWEADGGDGEYLQFDLGA